MATRTGRRKSTSVKEIESKQKPKAKAKDANKRKGKAMQIQMEEALGSSEEDEVVLESTVQEQVSEGEAFFQEVETFLENEGHGVSRAAVETHLEVLEMAFDSTRKQNQGKRFLPRYVHLKKNLKELLPAPKEEGSFVFPTVINVTNQKLPTFSGDFADWQAFEEAFRLEVDQRKESDAQKLQKLRKCLKDEARDMIEKFGLLEPDSYQRAWEAVRKHYRNSYEAFRSHVGRIFKHDSVEKNDFEKARKAISMIDASVEKLKGVIGGGEAIAGISMAAAVHLVTLMDVDTREQWKLNRDKKESEKIPTLEEVTQFYLTKAKSWEESKIDRAKESPNDVKRGERKAAAIVRLDSARREGYSRATKNSRLECYRCNGQHMLTQCPQFVKDTKEKKMEWLKKCGLCEQCGSRHPSMTKCWALCNKCKGSHPDSLCPQL